jgi:ketosteroid isomerase-like protein
MHPGPDFDLAPLVKDDEACAWWRDMLAHLFDPYVRATMRLPEMAPAIYSGMDGLRDAWRDWLEHWVSYHDEIEDVIDGGERVVVVHRCQGRLGPGAPDVTHRSATVWTVRDGLIVSVDFNVPHAEALTAVGLTG